jgi:hypothetical protein
MRSAGSYKDRIKKLQKAVNRGVSMPLCAMIGPFADGCSILISISSAMNGFLIGNRPKE